MSIVEAIIGIGVFAVVAVGVYSTFLKIFEAIKLSHARILAIALANEQFEIIRNLPFADVGFTSGIPYGKLPQSQIITRDSIDFEVELTIRNHDDPFDRTASTTPEDLSPADYKFVDVEVTCDSCKNFQPIYLTTLVAPKSLESASTNGSLFIKVFDANGLPVVGTNVHIENNKVIPSIAFNDVTNIDGMLEIIGAPPANEAYEISVSKSGYSSDRTYPIDGSGNTNPIKPNATVANQQITQVSFAIDKTSTLNINAVDETCQPIAGVPFRLIGSKLIGLPNVKKYDESMTLNDDGQRTFTGLEWDTYGVELDTANHDLIGIIPNFPFLLQPNSTQNVKFVLVPKNPLSLLVSIKDKITELPLSGVNINLEKDGVSSDKISGRGFLRQEDWAGGDGQEDFSDITKYYSDDGGVDTSTVGEFSLKKINETEYFPSGSLTSSTFDVGSPSNFYEINWSPINQPSETGEDATRLQIATNNDNTTWNFVGPDGTSASYFTIANKNINAVNNGNRYIRYKIFLNTADAKFTPVISETSFTFTSDCVPPGQVRFSGLVSGIYNLTISKTGYQTIYATTTVSNSDYRDFEMSVE